MLSILPLWILLNIYALLLDALAIAGGLGAWMLFSYDHSIFGWASAGIAVLFLCAAIRVHLTYPAKRNAYKTLYKRNCKTLHRASFYDFMDSPCYRMVVRTVLYHIGYPQEYKNIFKEVWGEPLRFCSFSPAPAEVIIFNSAEEGERWLKEEKS